ncbi:AUX/IAA domain [Sesbania bispinosa]|nr:AUX/IAA domain [Sesbania bispinosa]
MSVPLEHGYGGLPEVPSMEGSNKFTQRTSIGLNLKATELRLGLPGSESPERDGVEDKNGFSAPLGMLKSLVSGAKRGFSDAIDGGSGKWVLSGNGGSEVGLGKDGSLFSPRGSSAANSVALAAPDCTNQQTPLAAKESVPQSPKPLHEKKPQISAPAAKAQVVGWPPIRSFRKNSMATQPQKNDADAEAKSGCLYVKVSMKGQCGSYGVSSRENLTESRLMDLLHGSEYVLTYEDKDGDWMLVGDVPWEEEPKGEIGSIVGMFIDSCKRLRIMKSSKAIGLAPRAMEKCKSRN